MTFAKFEENWFRIDGEIAENHAILVNLTASIYGDNFCRFFGKKYFKSSDPFFVMYDDRCKSFIITAVGDIK